MEEVSHEMLVLVLPPVSSCVSGFPVASPCLWGKLQNLSFCHVANCENCRKSRTKCSFFCIQSCLESLVFLWRRRVYGGKLETCPFQMFPSRLSCRFAWQAWHFVTFQTCLIVSKTWKLEEISYEMLVFLHPHVMQCLISSRWFSGEAGKHLLFECVQAGCHVVLRGSRGTLWHSNLFDNVSKISRLEDVSHEMLVFLHPRVSSRVSGFTVASSCLWEKLRTLHSTLYTLHSTIYTLDSTLYTLHSTLYTLHFTLLTPHLRLYTPHSTLYTTLYTFHSSLLTLHFTLHTPHSTLYTLHFPLQTPHSTLYAPNSTLYTPHFTLHTLQFTNSTLLTLHSTLLTPRFTLLTSHSTLHTPHFALYTPHSTLCTLHSTLHTLHSTLYTLHSILLTSHATLHTLHFPLHTADW